MKLGFERMRNGSLALRIIAENDAEAVALNEWVVHHSGKETYPQEGMPPTGRPAVMRCMTGVHAQLMMKTSADGASIGVDQMWLEPIPVPQQPQPRQMQNHAPPARRQNPEVVVTDAPPG